MQGVYAGCRCWGSVGKQKDTSPITGAVLANKTLAPNRAVKKILEWFMVTCEKAGADAEELC